MEMVSMFSLVLCACIVPLMFWLKARINSQQRRISELQKRFDFLNSSVSALCAGTGGVDKRIATLEHQGRHLQHRQESMEGQQVNEHPYGEAIQRVHQGSSAEQLVEELGLSHSEADLVVMLHGLKKAI